MIVLVLAFAIIGTVTAGMIYGPDYYRKIKKENTLLLIEREGTAEQKQRVKEIRERDMDIKLKMLEVDQVRKVLESPGAVEVLRSANVDVENLKGLLTASDEDPLLEEFRLLEISQRKLLEENKK